MNTIDDIDHHFSRNDNWFGSFDCPNCNQEWGPSNHGDPPATETVDVKCDCGAVLRVSGEWVSEYRIDAEELDDE